jgi:hypothetical protein
MIDAVVDARKGTRGTQIIDVPFGRTGDGDKSII